VLAHLLDLLAPPGCLACRAPLASGVLCRGCHAALPWLRDPCPACALPRIGARCTECPARLAAFDGAWAPLAHAGPARELVLALKSGSPPAAGTMAAQIAARLPRELMHGATLVPLPPGRRGGEHAHRLAAALARRTGCPLGDCLRRARRGRRQVGSSRRARREGHRVTVRGPVPGRALLVDDVHTTGATLDAAARALRAAGCPQVSAVTYARTLSFP
jgi:predicted amidophosphoribosyltransferase